MGPEDENSNPLLQLNLRANISDVTVHTGICRAHHMSLKIVGDVIINILHLMCMQC